MRSPEFGTFPRSYTVFRAVVGLSVLLIGAASGWAIWTWVLPLLGIDAGTVASWIP